MIVAALRKKLASEARRWAADADVTLPENLALSAPPAHVKADLCLPWPLAAAKVAKRNPLELAKLLAAHLSKVPEVENAQAAPPGFVNIMIKQTALCANLKAITLAPKTYGEDSWRTQDEGPRRVRVRQSDRPSPHGLGPGSDPRRQLGPHHEAARPPGGTEYYVNDGGDRVVLLGESIMARYQAIEG